MKLKGTLTEDAYRAELLRSYNYIFNSTEGQFLHDSILKAYPNLKTAYVLNWTPEQGEDIFTLLINGETIIYIEIEKIIKKRLFFKETIEYKVISLSTCSIKDFRKGLSKINQIKLEVAIDLGK